MDFFSSIQSTYSKLIDFKSRATRYEFWLFYAYFIVGMTVSYVIDDFAGTLIPSPLITIGLFSGIFMVTSILPYISVGVRRLRDAGFSPYFYFLTFVPIAGILALLVMWQLPTKKVSSTN